MRHKLLQILQYHNAVIIIFIAVVLILSGYVFAQTDTGQEIIGEKQEKVISIDNAALLAADLDNFDMNFKILEINQDNATSTSSNYYITYAYRDLILQDNIWQWQEKTKTMEMSKKSVENRDLGDYIAEELSEIAYWQQKELKEKQDKAKQIGPSEKKVVTEYSGLIGKILDVKSAIFPGYEPIAGANVGANPRVRPEIAQIAPEPEIEIPITNNQTSEPMPMPEPEPVGAQFIAPKPEGLTRLPSPEGEANGGQVNQTPTEIPKIDNATTTEE